MAFDFTATDPVALTNDYDVIIIGSGAAGASCALQAHQLGLKPVILEKMATPGGNTMRASSGMNAAETTVQLTHHIADSFSEFYEETLKGGGLQNDRELLKFFVTHTPLAIDWLDQLGIELTDLTITGGMSKPRAHRPATLAPVGAYLAQNLLRLAQAENIPVVVNADVTELTTQPTADKRVQVTGVKVKFNDQAQTTLSAPIVVIATGGFGASKQLLQRFRPDLVHYKTTNQPGTTGDGIKLAQSVGASVVGMNLVQVHPTVQQDFAHTFLIGEAVRGEGAVLISQAGQRFVNELTTRRVVTDAINALPEHSAYLVFDQAVYDRMKAIAFYQSKGLVKQAATLAELASEINVPADKLTATMTAYNDNVAQQANDEFGRTMGRHELNQAPFYAIHIAPAVHYTMGGLHINTNTQVLDENGNAIAGLLAAGEVAGGLHGNNRIGGNSIAETVVFGRQAAITAARLVK